MTNASTWIGGALGVAIFSAIARSRTTHRLAEGAAQPDALTSGFRAALLAAAVFLAVAGVVAFRSRNATAADLTVPEPGQSGSSVTLPLVAPDATAAWAAGASVSGNAGPSTTLSC
jgi:hypothetical protein